MEILVEAADALEGAAGACENPEDAARFRVLVDRIRGYLATSRSTTPLGMPQIRSTSSQLTDGMVVHRSSGSESSHIRIVQD